MNSWNTSFFLNTFFVLSLSTLSLSDWMLHVIVLFHCAHYIQVVSKYCFMFAVVVVSVIYWGIYTDIQVRNYCTCSKFLFNYRNVKFDSLFCNAHWIIFVFKLSHLWLDMNDAAVSICTLLVWKVEIRKNKKAWAVVRRRGAVGSASDSWSVDTCQSWVRAPSKAPARNFTLIT